MTLYFNGNLNDPTDIVVLDRKAYIAGGQSGRVVVVGDAGVEAEIDLNSTVVGVGAVAGPEPSRNLADYGWLQSPHTGYWHKLTATASVRDGAAAYAQPLGATLATSDNATTNNWLVQNMAPGSEYDRTAFVWLGASTDTPGTWNSVTATWDDGTAWSYTNWATSRPNNSPAPQPYLGLYVEETDFGEITALPGEWNDGRASAVAAGVMQILDPQALTPANWTAIENEAGGPVLLPANEFVVATDTTLARYDSDTLAVLASTGIETAWLAQAINFLAVQGTGTQVSLRSPTTLTELTTYNCPFAVGYAIDDNSGGVWLFEKNGTGMARISLNTITNVVAAPQARWDAPITNPDASSGTTGWTVTDGSVNVWGGVNSWSGGPPPASGNVFYGEDFPSEMFQDVSLPVSAPGRAFEWSAFLGGFSSDPERAEVFFEFLDSGASVISSVSQIGPTNVERGNTTMCILYNGTGTVPAGAVTVRLRVLMDSSGAGLSNHSLITDVKFALPEVPGVIETGGGTKVSADEYQTSAANGVTSGYFRDNQLNVGCDGGPSVIRYDVSDPENIALVGKTLYNTPVYIYFDDYFGTERIFDDSEARPVTVASSSSVASCVCRVGGFIDYTSIAVPDLPTSWEIIGDAAALGEGVYRLTEEEFGQAGKIWFATPFVEVDISFEARVTTASGLDADGFAFVAQGEAADAVGAPGGGLGYSGYLRALAVEHDTFLNSINGGDDPTDNHIAVMYGDPVSFVHAESALATISSPGYTIADGAWHSYRAVLTPTNLTYFIDSVEKFNLPFNASLIYNPQGRFWIGFTAATGGSSSEHLVRNIVINSFTP